jgi:NAD(P)-dependent dehydrogenase (short-subunit alcohol dehydrogenase family)
LVISLYDRDFALRSRWSGRSKTLTGGWASPSITPGWPHRPPPPPDQAEVDFDRTVAINLKGVWLSMKYEIPAILRAGGGAIVNNASMGGLIAFAGLGPYHATKHGVLGLTKSAALDYAKTGLRINAVCPGIDRDRHACRFSGRGEQMQKFAAEKQPIGRGGDPEEIASAVIWLCSPGSSLMTGHHLVLDGGMTATA